MAKCVKCSAELPALEEDSINYCIVCFSAYEVVDGKPEHLSLEKLQELRGEQNQDEGEYNSNGAIPDGFDDEEDEDELDEEQEQW